MEILGIGLPEFGLILVIIFLVLGPKDMASTAKRIAKTIHMLTQSEIWRSTREAWKMAQDIPNELFHETGLDEARDDLNKFKNDINKFQRDFDNPQIIDISQQADAIEEEIIENMPVVTESESNPETSSD